MIRFKRQQLSFMLVILALVAGVECPADTHYVVPPGTVGANPADPYTNWATAGTNIIEVVNAARTNSTPRVVWVTNGVYYPTGQIYSVGSITIQSVNGRDVTILNGANATTSRCVYLSSSAAVLDGFTVTNYSTKGNDGVVYGYKFYNCSFVSNYCSIIPPNIGGRGTVKLVTGGIVTNCIFKNNYNSMIGGGIYANPFTSLRISGCRFEGNTSANGGGCGLYGNNLIVSNCVFINNSGWTVGGGLYVTSGTNHSVLNCTITGNVANASGGSGGGIWMNGFGVIKDCSIIENAAINLGGGIYVVGDGGTNAIIRNCLIARNQSTTNTGGGIWMTNGNVESCTIVSNYAAVVGGGVYLDGTGDGTNNIIYFNTAPDAANFTNTAGNAGLNYSCVIPAVNGAGNITNDPRMIDLAGGNYRLCVNSPCVNAGTNQTWMSGAVDLEWNARIRYGITDMGSYETVLRQGNVYRVR